MGTETNRAILRWLLAATFVLAGAMHFVAPRAYLSVMPPYLPFGRELVLVSGLLEILGGLGVLVPPVRRLAGWGLIALLIVVLPANIHMAINHIVPPGWHLPVWTLWARLPLQAVFIVWVYWCAVASPAGTARAGPR